ncbi:MAG: response regulator [Candidatus Omnitrophica bacterium]|nr:response regulator [Candidatus Omnitrophota bacterium]
MKRILIIDDEEDTLSLVREIFVEYGYRVEIEATGEEGLKRIKTYRPHLVLLDLRLPKMQGERVLVEIKRSNPQIKVIVGTGYGDDDSKENLRKLGTDAFFDKPIRVDQFEKTVIDLIGAAGTIRVLILDDDSTFLDAFTHFFKVDQETQWEIFTARTGEEALDKVRINLPDLFVTDIVLNEDQENPFHSGAKVYAAICKEGYRIPVVALGAYPDAYEAHREFKEMGVATVFAKDELIGGPDHIQHFLNVMKRIALRAELGIQPG